MFPFKSGQRTLIHYARVTDHIGRTHVDRLYARGDGTAELVTRCLDMPECGEANYEEVLDHHAVAAYLERELEHGRLDGWAGRA